MEIGGFYRYKGDGRFNFFAHDSVYKLVSVSLDGDIQPNEYVTCCFQDYRGVTFCVREMKCVMDSWFVASCMMERNWGYNEGKKEKDRHACLDGTSMATASSTGSIDPGMATAGHTMSAGDGIGEKATEELPGIDLGLDGHTAGDDARASAIPGKHPREDGQCRPGEGKASRPSRHAWLKDLCGVEAIDIARHMGFNLGNALEHVLRAAHETGERHADREEAIEDLRKAAFYIDDEIRRIESWN